jgi:hypothetical protein
LKSLYVRGLIGLCNSNSTPILLKRTGDLALSYSTKTNGYLYHQRVSSPLKKKRPDMFSECNADHPEGCDSPLQIVMAVWRPFCLNSNFLGRPLLTIMVPQKAITICRGLSHPTRSLSRTVCRGQERPKGRKGALRPDFQALDLCLKSPCHHMIQEDSCEEIQV